MSLDQIIFLIIFLMIILISFFTILFRNKKYKLNELQIKSQNLAYKVAFIFYVSYNIILIILNVIGIQVASFKVEIILGILITSIIFIGVCVFKDAFIPTNRYGTFNLISTGTMSIVYSIFCIMKSNQTNVNFFEQGKLTDDILYPIIGIWGLSLLIIFLINFIINKRTADNK